MVSAPTPTPTIIMNIVIHQLRRPAPSFFLIHGFSSAVSLAASREDGIGARCLSPPTARPVTEPALLPFAYPNWGGAHMLLPGRLAGERKGARNVPMLAVRGRSPWPPSMGLLFIAPAAEPA
jgi:hypothetical protein